MDQKGTLMQVGSISQFRQPFVISDLHSGCQARAHLGLVKALSIIPIEFDLPVLVC